MDNIYHCGFNPKTCCHKVGQAIKDIPDSIKILKEIFETECITPATIASIGEELMHWYDPDELT